MLLIYRSISGWRVVITCLERLNEFGTKTLAGNSCDLGQRNILKEKARFFSAFHCALLFTSAYGNCHLQPFWFSHLLMDVNSWVLLSTQVRKVQCANTFLYTSFQFSWLFFLYINQKSALIVLFFFFLFWITSAIASVSLLAESQPLGFLSSSREDDELENLKYLFTEGPKSTRVTTQSVKLRTEPPRQSLGRSVKSAAAVNPPGFVEHWQFTLAENPSPNLKNIQNGPKCAYLCS